MVFLFIKVQTIRAVNDRYGIQYGTSALISQTSFRGETSGGVAKCRLSASYEEEIIIENSFALKCFIVFIAGLQRSARERSPIPTKIW